jgi:hypothetical protein
VIPALTVALPTPLPTCRFQAPPVYTGFWIEESWSRWIAGQCNCYGHSLYRRIVAREKVGPLW